MAKLTVRDVDVRGKRVFVRVDFNVPIDKEGNVTDDSRIREALPTIKYLLERGAKVILASHLGRPKGQVKEELRLGPVAKRLEELLGRRVVKTDDCVGPEVEAAVAAMKEGDVLLLENVRFHPEEEKNDPEFARKLASLADLFVNDAFGTAHRAHASTAGIARYIPGVAGFLLEKEITRMGEVLRNPESPFVVVLGGAKVSDKIGVIENLLPKADRFLIGGSMANTFLRAQGYSLGNSKVEEDKLDLAREIMNKAAALGKGFVLPVDLVVAESLSETAPTQVVTPAAVPDGWMALDIGPRTRENYAAVIVEAATVFWNGPMGVFEMPPFAAGTEAVARALAECAGTTIVGGGDSAAAARKFGITDRVTHVSTGGGASLEFFEGKELPGIAVLKDKDEVVAEIR